MYMTIISNIFFSETAWPIKAKFRVKPPWEVGKKVYINGTGHMTRWLPFSFMVKTFKNILYRTNSPMIMKLGMEQYVLKLYKVYINDDPELTVSSIGWHYGGFSGNL